MDRVMDSLVVGYLFVGIMALLVLLIVLLVVSFAKALWKGQI